MLLHHLLLMRANILIDDTSTSLNSFRPYRARSLRGKEVQQARITNTPAKPTITILIFLYRDGDGDDTEAGGAKRLRPVPEEELVVASRGFTPQGTGLTVLLP
jgi:hypothetical protein